MDKIIEKITPTLLAAAILAAVTAIWRFESVAGEVRTLKNNIKENYTKKHDFVVVQVKLEQLKEQTKRIDQKTDIILKAVSTKENEK